MIPHWTDALGIADLVLDAMGTPARYVPQEGDEISLLVDFRPAHREVKIDAQYGKLTITRPAAYVAKRDLPDWAEGDSLVILRNDGAPGTTFRVWDAQEQQGPFWLLLLDRE